MRPWGDRVRRPVDPGAWLRAGVVCFSLAIAPVPSLAQEEGLSLFPSLGEDSWLDQGVGGQRPGEDGHGEAADGPLAPGVAGSADVVPVGPEEGVSEAAGQERSQGAAPPSTQDAGLSGGARAESEDLEPAGSSSLLGYLEKSDEEPGPVVAAPPPQAADVGAALFGCPRSVLERLLRAATERADVVTSLQIEHEVLALCGERQRLVVEILKAEGQLAELWRESRAPPPEAAPAAEREVRAEPADVVAQLTEFMGAEVLSFAEETVEVEPEAEAEPEGEPEPEPVPLYGWLAIFGTAGDLKARVSDGANVWFVREGDELPGGVVVDWIAVSPPGVHVGTGQAVEMMPYGRPREGGDG